jgi:DNA-binding transcriptional regulator LsrR (DeoR family)
MRKKRNDLEMIAVAYLRSQNNDQHVIAERLKISQSHVSRLIADAKKEGILEETIRFVSDQLPQEKLERAKARLHVEPLEDRIAALSPGRRPSLHIYPCHGRNTSAATWRHRIERFSGDCANDLLKVLASASIIGVAWGVMIASAVEAMQKMQTGRRVPGRSKQTIIPLLGEPLGRPITQHSSSVLASKLAEILDPNPDSKPGITTLSLAPVPAFIPADFSRAETSAIRKLIRRITLYQEIFGAGDEKVSDGKGKSSPLIERVDAILTSVSSEERPLGFDDDGLIRAADIRRKRLNELVIGDLCGVVIPRSSLDRQAKTEIKRIMAQWTGVRLDHLEACATRARNGSNSGPAGVIVLAIGANKASVVHEALRRGLIQHLFMDEDLADKLGEICAPSANNS